MQTVADFYLAKLVGQTYEPRRRKLYMIFSIVFNLTMLGFFKYFNFFSTSLAQLGQRRQVEPPEQTGWGQLYAVTAGPGLGDVAGAATCELSASSSARCWR